MVYKWALHGALGDNKNAAFNAAFLLSLCNLCILVILSKKNF